VQVVLVIGESQVAWGIPDPVLPGDDVFNVKCEERVIVFMAPAVFAALLRAPPNQFSRGRVYHEVVRSRARALA